jgi:hypothetical protein
MNKKKEENDKKLVMIFLYIACRSLKTRTFALQFFYIILIRGFNNVKSG